MNKIIKEKDFELPKVNEVTFENINTKTSSKNKVNPIVGVFILSSILFGFYAIFSKFYFYNKFEYLKIHEKNEIVNYILENPTRKNVSEYLQKNNNKYNKKKDYKEVLSDLSIYSFNNLLQGKYKFKNKVNSYYESLNQLKNKFVNFEINKNEYHKLTIILKNKDVDFKNNLKSLFLDEKITIDEYSSLQLKYEYKVFQINQFYPMLKETYNYPDININYNRFQKTKNEFKNELKKN